MEINIIVAVSENWVIGKDNKLLWRLSDDLKKFKELTLNKPIIMGDKTFYSLPKGALPNRNNIVMTIDKTFNEPNTIPVFSIAESLKEAEKYNTDVFITGGGSIYKQFLEIADTIYLTMVHTIIDGDTTFPELDDNWICTSSEFKSKDDKNDYDHTYKIYKRKLKIS